MNARHYTIRIIYDLAESFGNWPNEFKIEETACGVTAKSRNGIVVGRFVKTTRRLSRVTCKACKKSSIYKKHLQE
mgnify:CR=1 FL=1